ncbi:alpha/beta hydrolase [Variovorax sp. PBL-E5]|uniref:alpha/beta hydrolase n=1 Tax=Variovorax sp. PBL-E5 TaxID=434014 RepID=UPI00131986AE|nr:alpha/beta fold hydrolase [Variovorax sp. PBL-E5]VTU33997.1 2-hydroxymuconate semialdehyde hydrolase [Variovorax sp. PBL-E5]
MTDFSSSSVGVADYVTTSAGALRVYRAGTGPQLVVLPGLVMSAAVAADLVHAACQGWRVTVIELPGIGGSSGIAPHSPAQLAGILDEALTLLGIAQGALLALDLSAPIALALAARRPGLGTPLLLDRDKAAQWRVHHSGPSSLALRHDGGHLLALWSHFRDRAMLDPADPARAGKTGSPLPDDHALDAAVVAAAVRPDAYAALWACCAAGFAAVDGDRAAIDVRDMHELKDRLALLAGSLPPASHAAPPPADGNAMRYGYVQTPSGRVHLRRTGRGGRTLLMFHSAPGSAAPLEPLMRGLAAGREVIACDYLGNGDSGKAQGDIDIAVLARHALEVIDALGLDIVDLFGTHTGAMVAMELAIQRPERIGRMVLEAPVLIDADFAADILQHYLPPITPDRWGTHLLKAWNMRRDMFLFWPWYRQRRDAARSLGLPPLQTLHDWTVGLLKSGTTYHLSYRSAFVYDTRARLALLPRPAMICAGPADMLVEGLALARRLAPEGTVVTPMPATVWYPGQSDEAVGRTIAAYDAFLRQA